MEEGLCEAAPTPRAGRHAALTQTRLSAVLPAAYGHGPQGSVQTACPSFSSFVNGPTAKNWAVRVAIQSLLPR